MVYVMSDIHGDMERFQSVLNQIELQETDTLYVLGDIIDRHDFGIQILQQIMKMKNVKCILGNHELMCLNAIIPHREELPWVRNDPDWDLALWLHGGGENTIKAMQRISGDEVEEITSYLKALPVQYDIEVEGKKYKLVHSSPTDLFPADGSSEYFDAINFAVWNRIEDYSLLPDDYTVVFGHTPTVLFQDQSPLSIWHGPNAIGIDCGSGFDSIPTPEVPYQGRLACLRLNDMKEFYSDMPDTL